MRVPAFLALFAATTCFATDMDSARLTQAVYDGRVPRGWKAYGPGELNAKGINDDDLRRGDRWRGQVFERGDEIVCAWAGNLGGDEGLVVAQEIGLPMPEFLEAAQIARQVVRAFPDKKISFAGHSMGGGFASAAALATGKPAVIFNAQALHRNTIQAIGGGEPGEILHYTVKNEYATLVQMLPFFPKPMGKRIKLPNLGWDLGVAHNMDKVIEAMESVGIE